MEPKPPQAKPTRRKVYIVYYLSRGAQADQPHLIEGYLLPSQDCLRLTDVKQWLASLRGRGMPNSFAWSYRKIYNGGYIWHDVCDPDVVLPLCNSNEYVLMGSEIEGLSEDTCTTYDFRRNTPRIDVECQKTKESSRNGSSPNSPQVTAGNHDKVAEHFGPSPCARSGGERINVKRFSQVHSPAEYRAHSSIAANISKDDFLPVKSDGALLNQVRVYKAPALAWTSDQGVDVGTQTGESKRSSTEDASSQLSHAAVIESPYLSSVTSHNNRSNGMLSDLSTISTLATPDSEGSSVPRKPTGLNCEDSKTPWKPKSLVSSQTFKQLLSCGSVDVVESNVFYQKSMLVEPGAVTPHRCAQLRASLIKPLSSLKPCGGGSQDLNSVSGVSSSSRDFHGCNPAESAILRSYMVSNFPIESSSPGIQSLWSNSPKRSLDIETDSKGNLSTSPRRSLQFECCGSSDLTGQVVTSPERSPRVSVGDNITYISKQARGRRMEEPREREAGERALQRAVNWSEIAESPKKGRLKEKWRP